MTTDHRAEAERLLASTDLSLAAAFEKDLPVADQQHAAVLTGILTNRALTHATLALDEEQAASRADMRDALTLLRRREHAMRDATSAHIADGLTSTNRSRWSAARSLAQTLDAADANIDNDVDEQLADGGHDPKAAWNGSHLAAEPDPWAASSDLTADIPAPVVRAISVQLSSMLLSSDGEVVRMWARNFVNALKNEGADLTDAIQARIHDVTLGPASEPPF